MNSGIAGLPLQPDPAKGQRFGRRSGIGLQPEEELRGRGERDEHVKALAAPQERHRHPLTRPAGQVSADPVLAEAEFGPWPWNLTMRERTDGFFPGTN